MLHDGAGEFDRVSDVVHTANRTGLERGPFHDGGVELVLAVHREHGTVSGIEQRIVLEQHHGARHRIEARAAALEDGKAGGERGGQARAILLFAIDAHLAARQGPRAAVNR